MPDKKVLLLFIRGGEMPAYYNDWGEIARRIERIDNAVDVKICSTPTLSEHEIKQFSTRPTLAVVFYDHVPSLLRGRVIHNTAVSKLTQLKAYSNAGIPFPSARAFTWGSPLEEDVFGEHVVIKPANPKASSTGNIWVRRRVDVEAFRREDFPPNSILQQHKCLVQRYVDTGENPESFRVTILCHAVVLAYKMTLKKKVDLRGDLTSQNFATNGGDRVRCLVKDADVIELARRATRCLPFIPLQGIDVIREKNTANLFVLESNCGGNVWRFSSRLAGPMRKQKGMSRVELLNQFTAYESASRALISATQALAE